MKRADQVAEEVGRHGGIVGGEHDARFFEHFGDCNLMSDGDVEEILRFDLGGGDERVGEADAEASSGLRRNGR